MIHFDKLRLRALSLSVLGALKENAGVKALIAMTKLPQEEELAVLWAEYYRALVSADCEQNSGEFFRRLIFTDDNVFARRLSTGSDADALSGVLKAELQTLHELSRISPDDFVPSYGESIKNFPVWKCGARGAVTLQELKEGVRKNGYGVFALSVAYAYDASEKSITALKNVNPVRLRDIKEYEDCKKAVADNTRCFVEGLPANNVLLYGDRGTGKSSTVHAVLNEYSDRGLRLLQVSKSSIPDFPVIFRLIENMRCFRFVIFIDDLTFIEGADNFAELKAALEGSVSRPDNVVIYATTNRRHLLKESIADRTGDLHESDTIQEQMSLSDRFGLVLTYINPDKQEFFAIASQILADRGIELDGQLLSTLAERYALKKGGRSGRAAKQLADMIESRIRLDMPLSEMF